MGFKNHESPLLNLGQIFVENDSKLVVVKVRKKTLSVEKVHATLEHLSGTVCLLRGIATRGLSHRENRTPRRSFRLNNIS